MARIDELIEQIKEYAGWVEKPPVKKKCNVVAVILTIIGIIAVIAGVCYAVYRFLGPSYYEDFEDDYEDDDDMLDDGDEIIDDISYEDEEED